MEDVILDPICEEHYCHRRKNHLQRLESSQTNVVYHELTSVSSIAYFIHDKYCIVVT